jgi:hypothetical protein
LSFLQDVSQLIKSHCRDRLDFFSRIASLYDKSKTFGFHRLNQASQTTLFAVNFSVWIHKAISKKVVSTNLVQPEASGFFGLWLLY